MSVFLRPIGDEDDSLDPERPIVLALNGFPFVLAAADEIDLADQYVVQIVRARQAQPNTLDACKFAAVGARQLDLF